MPPFWRDVQREWEQAEGDPMTRGFLLLMAAGVVGTIAFFLAQLLWIFLGDPTR